MTIHTSTTSTPDVPGPVAADGTPEQLAAVKALMEELHKKTTEAAEAAAKLPQGMVSDTIKLG